MNREIKFRMFINKGPKSGEWFYWGFCGDLEGEFIWPLSNYRKSPSFQYTGLKDKNGVEIYEGDVMQVHLPMGGFWGNIKTQKTGTVKYESDYGDFIVQWECSKNQHHIELDCDVAFEGEVIGNIYQTPELMPK